MWNYEISWMRDIYLFNYSHAFDPFTKVFFFKFNLHINISHVLISFFEFDFWKISLSVVFFRNNFPNLFSFLVSIENFDRENFLWSSRWLGLTAKIISFSWWVWIQTFFSSASNELAKIHDRILESSWTHRKRDTETRKLNQKTEKFISENLVNCWMKKKRWKIPRVFALANLLMDFVFPCRFYVVPGSITRW